MLSSMTLAEIQAKYSGIHTPEEIDQFHQNMTNSKKWKIVKNEWRWDGLNHVDRLRRVALITVVINGVLAVGHVLHRGHLGALGAVHVNELIPDGSLLIRTADGLLWNGIAISVNGYGLLRLFGRGSGGWGHPLLELVVLLGGLLNTIIVISLIIIIILEVGTSHRLFITGVLKVLLLIDEAERSLIGASYRAPARPNLGDTAGPGHGVALD